jgi:hypothetical protein
MDPFTTLQNNMQRDVITQDFTGVLQLILDGQNDRARERVEALNNRADGIAQPVRDIRNFAFMVPEHNLEDIFQQPNYTRPKPMVHYRVENGTKYYNANLACLAFRDPEEAGFLARQAAAVGGNNNNGELQNIYNAAKAAQMVQNTAAATAAPNWVICQRTEPNNTTNDDMCIRFTDETQKTVDWYVTIRNLHQAGQRMGYTLRHYHDAMTRFVSYFKPAYSSLITNMDANETARFLMDQNTPVPEKQRHFKAIKTMNRPVGTPLKAVMSELHIRARGYYAEEAEANRPTLINNLMIQGLQAFTAGTTHLMLRKAIQQQILEDRQLRWDRMLETAIQSEETSGEPTATLYFMPGNQVSFFNTIPIHNTIAQSVGPLVPPRMPQVRPLVHIDRRNRQNFYTANYSQLQPYQNAFYNMQNPIMPIQPPALQQPIIAQPVQQPVVQLPLAPPAIIQQPIQVQAQVHPELANLVIAEAPMQDADYYYQDEQQQELGQAQAPYEEPAHLQPATPQQLAARLEQLQREQQAGVQEADYNLGLLDMQDTTPPPTDPPRDPYPLRDTEARLGAIKKGTVKNLAKNYKITPHLTPGSPLLMKPETFTTTILLTQAQQIQKLAEDMKKIAAVNSTVVQPTRAPNPTYNAQPHNQRQQTPPRQYNDQRNNQRYQNRSRPNSPSNNNYNRPNSPRDRYSRDRNNGSYTPPRDDRRDRRSSYQNRPRSQSPYRNTYRDNNSYRRPMSPRNQERSYSPSNNYPRPNSPNRYSGQSSPNNYRSNQRDNYRNRSPSPYRQNNSQPNEQSGPVIPGINCNPNYTKNQGQLCTKCNTFGRHQEHACPNYYQWAPRACATCHNGFHNASECMKNRQPSPGRDSPTQNRGNFRKNS